MHHDGAFSLPKDKEITVLAQPAQSVEGGKKHQKPQSLAVKCTPCQVQIFEWQSVYFNYFVAGGLYGGIESGYLPVMT